MTSLVSAELHKAIRLRSLWILVAAGVALSVGFTVLSVLVFRSPEPTAQGIRDTYSMAGQAYLLAVILGVVVMTGEYRYQTITQGLLVTPRRGQLIAGKMAACAVIGLVLGIAAAAASGGVAAVMLAATGAPAYAPGATLVLLGSTVVTALWAVFGAALGALIRHQVAAIVIAFVWFVYLEWFLIQLTPDIGRWVPSGASRAAIGWSRDGMVGFDGEPIPGQLLPVWAGALLFAGYCLALAAAATASTVRRDVT